MKYEKPLLVVLDQAIRAISCSNGKGSNTLDSVAGCPGPPTQLTNGAAYEADE